MFWAVVVVVVVTVDPGAAVVVSDLVTVAVGAAGAGLATLEGSEVRSMDSYFECVWDAGLGCEQETRQSTKRRDTIVFIF